MEGNSGFQAPTQAHYQYLHQPPPLQGKPPANISASQPPPPPPPPNTVFKSPKWTDEMLRLMITAISYLMEVATTTTTDSNSNKNTTHMSTSTKWKVISLVMSERGHTVSPQHCENKFLKINQKYKQLIALLGKPASCKIFENPILLETTKISERKKAEVRNILESRHFLYREMCSLHHGNRLFIPHDLEVQKLVVGKVEENEREVLRARWARLEEMKLEMQEKRLEFEKGRFEWLSLDHNEEMKIEKMRLENEELKFENARLAFELKRKEWVVGDGN